MRDRYPRARRFPPGYWREPCRDPFHLGLAAVCLLSGLIYTLTGEASDTLETLPQFFQNLWAFSLLACSVLIFIGVFWPKHDEEDTGYWFELGGWSGLGSLMVGYGIAIVSRLGTAGFGASTLFVLGLCCYVWCWFLIEMIRQPHVETHEEKVIEEVKKLAEEQARDNLPEEYQ